MAERAPPASPPLPQPDIRLHSESQGSFPQRPRGMPQIEATFDTEGKTFTTYEDTAVVMINKSEGAWGPPQRWPQSTTVPPCSHRQRHKPHQCYNQCYDVNGVNGDSCSRGFVVWTLDCSSARLSVDPNDGVDASLAAKGRPDRTTSAASMLTRKSTQCRTLCISCPDRSTASTARH